MELEAQVEALDKELKNEDHRFPINQSRKSDFLFTISLLLQNSQKSEISTVQAKLEAIFLQIASQGCSAPLSRLLKKCINLTLSTGNTNRAGDNLYEYLKQASSLKLSISARSTALRMIGNLYLEFGQKIPSPPTDDLIELSKRIYKTSDIPLKISNVKCLTDMSASRPNNLNGVSLQEFIKILIRYSAEKPKDLKIKSAKALKNIIKNYPGSISSLYEHIFQALVKCMEDNTHEIFSEAIGELLSLQIDIKIEIKNTGNLKKAETIPKTVLDAISTITQYYSRNPQFEAKAGLIKALDIVLKIFLKNSLQGNNEITVFMEHILAIPRHGLGNDYDNWRTTENIAWMLHKCVEIYISDSQANLLLSFCLAKLNELKSQVHDSGVIENEFASKRSTDPLIEIQVILLLRTLEYLFSRVTPERDFPKYGDGIYRPILTYLSSGRISKTASRALGTLTYKFPSIHFQLMSLLLTYTTIAHAQLAGLKPEQCSRESFQDCMNSLLGNSLALATIIKCLPLCNRGIPSEISSTVLNTVKAMISGEYQGDVIEDENVFKDDGISQEIDNVKREAGWILIESLMHLGPNWVGGCLTSIFSLWKLPFGRQSCIIEDKFPVHLLIGEVTHKKAASSSLLSFIKNNQTLLNPQIFKLISVFLSNALQFICPQKKSTARRQLLDQHCQFGDLVILKKNLFECLKYVSTQYLANKIPLLLHPICSEIVCDKINSIPLIYEEWLSPEDHYLNTRKQPHLLYELSHNCYQEYVADNWLERPFDEKNKENIPKGNNQQIMLNTALLVFAEIFTSSSFNVSNRQKLFKYLSQHLTNSLKLKDNIPHKYLKISAILLATLGGLRKLALSRAVITDSELISIIRSMFDSVESTSHHLVKRIYAEGTIYLCKVMADPQHIPVFIKEVEHRIILSEHNPGVKSSIVLLVAGMYKHFDIALMEKNQLSLGHIIQSISRDAEIGGWAIHALYKIYNLCGHRVEAIIKATFPLGFHHYLDNQESEFNFRESMLMLCMKYLQLNLASNELIFMRSEMVWQDRWESSEYGLESSTALIQSNVKIDFDKIFVVALSRLPNVQALNYFADCVAMGYGDYYLAKTENFVYDLFKIFDEWDTWKTAEELSKFEDLIDSFIIIQSRKDTKKSIMLLKSVISSVETNDDNKGETQGLSSHDDRRDNHVSLVFKHHFRNFTKKFALKLLADLIVNYPDNLPVEELINLGCHLASSEAETLKIYGLKLIRKIYKVSGHVKDTEDPKNLMIELYEAQVSAIIRESLDCRNISVEMHANKLFLKFLMTPGTQEISVVNKLINPIIGSLSLNPKSNIYLVIILDGYSDNFCSKLYLSRLITLAKLLLYSPLFIQSILIDQKSILIANLNALVIDMSVIFTQPKMTLKSYDFLLGQQVLDQDDTKMGQVGVLIYALAYLAEPESEYLPMLIAEIYIFMFLPYSASRESPQFKNQLEIDYFINRREKILRALEIVIKHVKDSRIISEILNGLELCVKIPDIEHKTIILKICCGIYTTDPDSVIKIENLVIKIREMHQELEKESIEAWSYCVILFTEIVQNEGLDEHKDVTTYVRSIMTFFDQSIKHNHVNIVYDTLEKIWLNDTGDDFKSSILNKLLLILIENKNFDTVLHFLAKRSTDELAYFAVPIKSIADLIREYSEKSLKIASILTGIFPQNPVIFSVLIPHVLSVFQLRKTTEYSQNETNMQNEALRLLVLLFKAHPDKTKALKALIPMIFSLYSTQTAVNLVKTVTKTVHFLASSCPAGFKEIIQILPDYEKKFLETQLVSSQQAGPVSNIAQPTITLQLKLKKP